MPAYPQCELKRARWCCPAEGRRLATRTTASVQPAFAAARGEIIGGASTDRSPERQRQCRPSGIDDKASRADHPGVRQSSTTASDKCRRISLCRKRPWPFLEKLEWSGTLPSNFRRQNPPYARSGAPPCRAAAQIGCPYCSRRRASVSATADRSRGGPTIATLNSSLTCEVSLASALCRRRFSTC